MNYNFNDAKIALEKVGEWLTKEYTGVHTGRATPSLLDTVSVLSYGSMQPIKNVASVSIEDPKTLRVSPWDKGQIKDIEKAIAAANLGLSTSVDDMGLRVIFPMLTTERRVQLVKVLKEKMEDARVSVRQERERILKEIDALEKEGGMSEDEKFRAKDELQKYVDETNRKLEAIFAKKEAEVMN